MAYARFGEESDVYFYKSGSVFVCCGCPLRTEGGYEEFPLDDPRVYAKVGTHLLEHVSKGHKVPDHTFQRLAAEAETWQPPKE